ncbi:MAG: hypothetical protein B7X92_16310, partial [Novosphingobium sp. 17-62-9]
KSGPFTDVNTDEAVTVTASGVTGSVTITASAAIFSAGHVGSLFRIEAKDFSDIPAWEALAKDVAIGNLRRSDGKVYSAATAGVTGSVPPTHDSGTEWDGSNTKQHNDDGPFGVKWTYLHDRFGIAQITAVAGDGLSCTATVLRRFPGSTTSVATHRWAHSVWSAAAGYPQIVLHAFGRQVHFKDYDLCASVSGDFLNHQAFTSAGTVAADMAFRRRLAADNPPLWALADRKAMQVGTASIELAIAPVNAQAAVSGDNIDSSPQSFYGSEPVWPVQVGSEAVFVERGGRQLRSAAYDFGSDRYLATDLTAAAGHITAPGLVQLAPQRSGRMLHAVREDGQIITHPINRGEIKGFGRLIPGGDAQVLSAVCVMGDDGKTDDLWVLVSRDTPGGARKEVWKQSRWRDLGDALDEAFFVDAGLRIEASAGQNVFSGLTHLAGQAVAVLAGGGVIAGQSVASDGTLTLPAELVPVAAYTLIVGLPYTARAVTLRPYVNAPGGWQGFLQKISNAFARLIETVGMLGGATDGPLEDVIERPANAAMDAQIPAYTGDVTVQVTSDPDRDTTITMESATPLPATIAMLSFKIESGDR